MPIAINGTGTITGISVGGLPDAIITGAELDGAQTGSAPIYGARAWVKFTGEGTPTIRASGNVSSITDVQTGVYNVNLTTSMTDSNYAAVVTGSEGGGAGDKLWAYSISSSAVRVVVYNAGGSLVDNPNCQVAVFR
jgi:hypothetical protein